MYLNGFMRYLIESWIFCVLIELSTHQLRWCVNISLNNIKIEDSTHLHFDLYHKHNIKEISYMYIS